MTNAELAILGLVLEKPRHGYEIEQVLEARGMREWTEVGFSSIYYILKKLEKEGLVKGQRERQSGRGPERRVYQITGAGEKAWQEATLEALSGPHLPSTPFLLGLAGLPGLAPEEAVAALRAYQEQLSERKGRLEGRQRELGEHPPLFLEGMFDYSVRLVNTEMEWLEGFIRKLEAKGASK